MGLYGDQFKDKVAIVTGSGGGIGQAYAEALAREGAAVVVADINVEGAQKVADGIKGEGGNALALRVDVSDPDSAKEMAAQTLSEFGGIDYLVNNAAIFGGMKLDFLVSVDWDYYKKFMSVNMDGALVCTRAVYRKMAKRGGGAIINQSSTAAWMYSNFYGLAKVGINGLTQQLATELGGQNIRINAIAPGPINTEANRTTTPQEMVADIVKGIPLSRMGEPEDLIGMCLSCCRIRRSGSPGRYSMSMADRSSGHDRHQARLHRPREPGRPDGEAPGGLARRSHGLRRACRGDDTARRGGRDARRHRGRRRRG